MADLFSLKAKKTSSCQEYTACQNETKVQIGEATIGGTMNDICYQLRFDQHPFQHVKESLIITANSNLLANGKVPDNERGMWIYLSNKNLSSFTIYISGDDYIMSTTFAQKRNHRLTLGAIYESLASSNKCSEYKTRETFFAECRTALFREMCNCTPTTWSSWIADGYKECQLIDYTFCANYSSDEDKCDAKADLCESWQFDIRSVQVEYSYSGAIIELSLSSLNYPVFTEKFEYSLEEFLGAFGGAVGFYLGLDFFRLFLIIINIISLLVSWFIILKNKCRAWFSRH